MKNTKAVLRTHLAFTVITLLVSIALLLRLYLQPFNENTLVDMIGHFMLPAFLAPLIYALIVRTGFFPTLKESAAVLLIILLGTGIEVAWEIFEFYFDILFDATSQPNNADTMMDIILAVVGSAAGGLLFVSAYKSVTLRK